MANIRMRAPAGITSGTVTLSDGTSVTVASGYASVTPQQWQAATDKGFQHDDVTQQPAPFRQMSIPPGGTFPTSGTITAPDGVAITITGGKAYIPAVWVNRFQSYGWV
jgi:hypothetical protein